MERKTFVKDLADCAQAQLRQIDGVVRCSDVNVWRDSNHDEDFRADFILKYNGKNYKVLVTALQY